MVTSWTSSNKQRKVHFFFPFSLILSGLFLVIEKLFVRNCQITLFDRNTLFKCLSLQALDLSKNIIYNTAAFIDCIRLMPSIEYFAESESMNHCIASLLNLVRTFKFKVRVLLLSIPSFKHIGKHSKIKYIPKEVLLMILCNLN